MEMLSLQYSKLFEQLIKKRLEDVLYLISWVKSFISPFLCIFISFLIGNLVIFSLLSLDCRSVLCHHLVASPVYSEHNPQDSSFILWLLRVFTVSSGPCGQLWTCSFLLQCWLPLWAKSANPGAKDCVLLPEGFFVSRLH